MSVTTDSIQKLYITFFNRPADPIGLSYWTNLANANGGNTAIVAASFAGTAEYKAIFTGLNPGDSVNAVYLNLFGRPAEAAGLNYWAPLIANGTLTLANIATAIAAGAQGADAAAITAKLTAANQFTTNVDVANEILGYSGDAANAVAKAWLVGVIDATTLAAKLMTVDATIAAAVAAHDATATGVITPLTASIDTFVGTANNDVFTANAASFNTLDSLDGGAGVDTLNVSDAGSFTAPTNVSINNIENVNFVSGGALTADTTGYNGVLRVSGTSVTGTTLTVAATTAATGTASAGAVSITGGLTQNAVSKGGLTLSGATGAIVASDSGQAAANTTIDGGTTVALVSTGITTGNITVGGTTAPTGTINITATDKLAATGTAGAITSTGGTTVTVTENITSTTPATGLITATGGAVTVNGKAATTTVSVSQTGPVTAVAATTASAAVKSATASNAGDVTTAAVLAAGAANGVINGSVTIADLNAGSATAAATITTVTLANYGNSTISSNALSTLNLAGAGGTLGLTSGLTTETTKTLNLTTTALAAGTITDTSNHYTTINVTTAGAAKSTIAGIADSAATALTVAGTQQLVLTSAAGLSALKTVTVSGAASLNADVSGVATVTDVNASASSGANTVKVLSTQTTYEGGSGVDTVTINAVSTKVIDGGAGSSDVLVVDAASYATNAKNVNFEILKQGVSANGAFDATGFTALQAGAIAGASTFNNVVAGAGLTITNQLGFAETVNLANTSSSNDVFNLTLNANPGLGNIANTVVIAGVETVNVSVVDTGVAGHATTVEALTLTDAAATAINISGAGGVRVSLTSNSVALTSVDASGLTGAGFDYISTAFAAAATVKGSAAFANNVDLSAAVAAAVTYVGGSGNDNVILSTAAKANVLTLGDGTNVVTGATTGNNTITGGAGSDTFITSTAGNNTVSFGNGANFFTTTGNGANIYTGGTGVDTVTVAGGSNTITTGTGADVVTFTAVVVNGNSYSTITDAHAGEIIKFTDAGQFGGTSTFSSTKLGLADTAVFQDYLDAATAGAGTATNSNISWFQFGGNTYLVEDNSAATTYQNGGDTVVKLTGLLDLSTATFAAAAGVSSQLTLA